MNPEIILDFIISKNKGNCFYFHPSFFSVDLLKEILLRGFEVSSLEIVNHIHDMQLTGGGDQKGSGLGKGYGEGEGSRYHYSVSDSLFGTGSGISTGSGVMTHKFDRRLNLTDICRVGNEIEISLEKEPFSEILLYVE